METIYSITSDKGDKVYIGRTKQQLCRRKAQHKFNKCRSAILFDEYGFHNCIFTALEECAKEQGSERERHYIETTPNTVNRQTPGRTDEEYRKATKEQMNDYQKEYYKENKERIDKRHKEHYEANKEKERMRAKAYYAKKKSLLH